MPREKLQLTKDGGRPGKRRDDWETPDDLFRMLDKEFGFTLDACATAANAKLPEYCSPKTNGLRRKWAGQCVWCNPPYSNIGPWMRKAFREAHDNETVSVLLVPPRTDQSWWHECVLRATEIRFIKGRVAFLEDGVPQDQNRHPSCLVVFVPGRLGRVLGPNVRTQKLPKDISLAKAAGALL
jgi:phage N-6-adenine-methyltransferase